MTNSLKINRRQLLHVAGGALIAGHFTALAAAAEPGPQTHPGQKAEVLYGVCGSMGNARMLKDAGCDYIEEAVGRVLVPDKDDVAFAKLQTAISTSLIPIRNCNSFLPGSLKSVGPDAKHEAILSYANTAFKRAHMVGIDIITFGSGGSRKIPTGWSKDDAKKQFIELLKGMGPLAAAQNLKVAVEPLNARECNFLNNIREVAECVTAADHPNIGITADLYHMVLGDDLPEHLDANIHLLHHFHIAEKKGREMPGVGGDDFRGWFQVLAKHGWKGRMSIEGGKKKNLESYTAGFTYLRSQAKDAGI